VSKEPLAFEKFVRDWGAQRILAPGVIGVDRSDREKMVRKYADELREAARKRGFLVDLKALGKAQGDVRGYVSFLIRQIEDRGQLDG